MRRSAPSVLIAVVAAGTASLLAPTAASAAPAPLPAPTVRSVGVGSNPIDAVVSQSLGKLFVANDGSISVVSLLTRRELAEFGTGADHGQSGIALVRGGRRAYVTTLSAPTVAVVDTETYRVATQAAVGGPSTGIVTVRTPRGERAYVSLQTNRLVALRTSDGSVATRIRLPRPAQALTAGRGGRVVWVGSAYSGRVWAVDTRTHRIVRTLKVDRSGPVSSIALAPGGRRAWVAGLGGVSVGDLSTRRTVRFISASRLFAGFPNVGDVALTRSGRYALVENSTFPDAPAAGTVALVDTRTYRISWRVTTGIEPTSLVVDRARRTAYTTNYADDTVSWFRVPR